MTYDISPSILFPGQQTSYRGVVAAAIGIFSDGQLAQVAKGGVIRPSSRRASAAQKGLTPATRAERDERRLSVFRHRKMQNCIVGRYRPASLRWFELGTRIVSGESMIWNIQMFYGPMRPPMQTKHRNLYETMGSTVRKRSLLAGLHTQCFRGCVCGLPARVKRPELRPTKSTRCESSNAWKSGLRSALERWISRLYPGVNT